MSSTIFSAATGSGQRTITKDGEATTVQTFGRHDPCLLPRFVPMAEAMVALVLADHLLRSRAQRL